MLKSLINRYLRCTLGCLVALTLAACTSNTPLKPSATIGTPQALQPADGAQIANATQPITLVTQNATISGSLTPTYTFEVATDPSFTAFTSKVQTKDGVAQGSGMTTVTLDPLPASKDYYWHVRAEGGGATGPFSATFRFTVGAAVTIGAPTQVTPADGAQTGTRPTFTVTNGSVQGNPGAITYKFEVSTSSAFTSTVVTGTVAAGASQTSFTPPSDLPSSSSLFWRATGLDASNNITGTPSGARSFTTGTALWPGVQPPGTNGHATKGDNWQPQVLTSYCGVQFNSPPIDEQRVFDLMDRGFDPQGAIDWMHANGYPTGASWYPGIQVIAFNYTYLALINGRWDLVLHECSS